MIEPGNLRETYPIDPKKTLGMDVVMLTRFVYDKAVTNMRLARKIEGMQPIRTDGSTELQDRISVVMQELDMIKRIIINHIPDEVYNSDRHQ